MNNSEKQKKRRKNCRQYVYDFLKNKCCKLCDEANICTLEFHHRDPKTKLNGISKLISQGITLTILKLELVKCDVLCSNCHKKITAKEQNWYKDLKK